MNDVFQGFSPDTIAFLRELRTHNNKQWFEEHRGWYQQVLMQPMYQLADELGTFMADVVDPFLIVAPPSKVVSRIHRDTRFSKDKSPYKTTVWLTFKRPAETWQSDPAFFFELGTEAYRYGMGFFQASKETMDRWRAWIDEKPEELLEAMSAIDGSPFVVEGDLYKKPMGLHHSERVQPWYGRKNIYLVCNSLLDERLYCREILEDLRNGFAVLAPLYHRMWRVKLESPISLRGYER